MKDEVTHMVRWIRGVMCTIALCAPAGAFEKNTHNWSYMKDESPPKKPGVTFIFCTDKAPAGASVAIKKAAEKWNYSKFEFKFSASACVVDDNWSAPDGKNEISFGDISTEPSAPGVTAATPDSPLGAKTLECDIRFAGSFAWHTGDGSPKKDTWDLRSVALHELGHCLGLDHVEVAGAVMNADLKIGTRRFALTSDDIDGRKSIYGEP